MSRAKSRTNSEVCGDCSSPNLTWAIINKGIFICNQCCNTHRSLGRHISNVKSLQKSTWAPTLLEMVHALNTVGANSIWEHALERDPKLMKRKPTPISSIEDKEKFIRSKHQNCEFVLQMPTENSDQICVENELSKQLHASVRSASLLTSLKLLMQGADPNYFHDEKMSTPLHAAVKANQFLQAELLMVYGADPTYPDAKGKTPIEHALAMCNKPLANRLTECQYEVTDKFSYYLVQSKPDHSAAEHILIPVNGPRSHPTSMEKLRKLSNQLFEELVKDVYDEVERREMEAIWLGSADTIELNAVPFLPVDQSLSKTRNQSRQKLGRFASPELKALIFDILIDYKRRLRVNEKGGDSDAFDDDPLYDSVASDDDYAVIDGSGDEKSEKSPEPGGKDQNQNSIEGQKNKEAECESLKVQLREANENISSLKLEISNMKSLVEHLSKMNHQLNGQLMNYESTFNGNKTVLNGDSGSQSLDGYLARQEVVSQPLTNGSIGDNNNVEDYKFKKTQRPLSMYETREGLRTPNWQLQKNQNEVKFKQSKLLHCTHEITKGISHLWKCIQGTASSGGRENCVPCADKIRFAVTNLTEAIPKGNAESSNLLESMSQLQTACLGLQAASKAGDVEKTEEYRQKVRTWAYEIAATTKSLFSKYNSQ